MDTIAAAWHQLGVTYALTTEQISTLQQYVALLQREAKLYNLTALEDTDDIIAYHIADSLALVEMMPLDTVSCLVDVGTGAGLPGVVLKIKYPHLRVILLEVIAKRRAFLAQVVSTCALDQVTIIGDDWRTWLRSRAAEAEVVCARASLQPKELLRMFQPSSPLRSASLIYWAAEGWEPASEAEAQRIQQIHWYTVGDRQRKLVCFGL